MKIVFKYLLITAFLISLIANDFQGMVALKAPLIGLLVIAIIISAVIDIKKKLKESSIKKNSL